MTRTPDSDPAAGLEPWAPEPSTAPPADAVAEPQGYLVESADGTRLHFLDWGEPGLPVGAPGVLLLPGLLQPASSWAPVARRLRQARRTVVADLRGQGLSDAPMTGYELEMLAADVGAVADGAGLLPGDAPVILAGHGFGAIVAAAAAGALGDRCAGLVLVDGGWERLEAVTGVEVEEFLRGFDEPPEVLRSMAAYLGDRRAFDPATWDPDQERAARDAVVETAAGHVVRAVRPFVVEALVRTMFAYDPADVVAAVAGPVTALVAHRADAAEARLAELRRTGRARAVAGLSPIRVAGFPAAAHNLMRYRPAEVASAIVESAG